MSSVSTMYRKYGVKGLAPLGMPPPPGRFISAQGVCPTNLGIDHLDFEATDADIGGLAYYPHIAPGVVMLVIFPPPEPIVGITGGSYVKIPLLPNETPALAHGVVQAIIKGGTERQERHRPINSTTYYGTPPFDTRVID